MILDNTFLVEFLLKSLVSSLMMRQEEWSEGGRRNEGGKQVLLLLLLLEHADFALDLALEIGICPPQPVPISPPIPSFGRGDQRESFSSAFFWGGPVSPTLAVKISSLPF